MRLMQIIYFFVVSVPAFIVAYSIIEVVDFIKKITKTLTK